MFRTNNNIYNDTYFFYYITNTYNYISPLNIHTYMKRRLENINMRSIWVFSAIITLLLIANAAKMVYSDNSTIDSVISEGLQECYNNYSAYCDGVYHVMDSICQVEYFKSCFGDQWFRSQ